MRLAFQRAGLAGCATGSCLADSLRRLLEAACRVRDKRIKQVWKGAMRTLTVVEHQPGRDSLPAAGRRCLRTDLDHRDRVVALALRKERFVGPPARGFDRTGGRPVRCGRRFEYARSNPADVQSRTSPST